QAPPAALPPARVMYHAPIYDPSGYADEARHLILHLEELGVPVAARALGRHSPTFQAQVEPAVRARLDRALARTVTPNFISVIHFPGSAFQRLPEAGYRVGRTMFETDSLPKDWVAACNLMDEIWVPSEFNRETFSRAGVTAKLVTVPGGVDTFRFRPGLAPRRIPGARGTVFLSVFEWSFRKGWDVLLQAWARAFTPDADVTLVLRTYPINKTEGGQDMDAWVTMFLREGLKLERHQVAPIVVIQDQVPDAEMPNLYAAAHAYVAPSRGEGWGRPQMEAMASGLPVIATRWSGNMAFMTEENALLLDVDGVVPIDGRAEMDIYHGQNWAEPSIDHLVTLLRRVAAEPQAMADVSRRARADMELHWRWDKAAAVAAERLTAIASELDARPSPPPPAPDSLPVQWEGAQLNFDSFAMVNRELAKRLIASGRVELAATSKERIEFKPTPDLVPVERALAHRLTRPPAVTVRHQWPPDFTPPAAGAWVMVQPWEFGGLPDAWVAGMRHGPDEMWVYTHWLRDCYIKSGLPADRVHVVPLGVDVDRHRPEGPAYPLKTKKRFKFLFLGGAIPRKGVDVLLDAYLTTFTADDDVCLVIKGIGGETFYSNSPMSAMIRQLLEQAAGDPRMPEVEYLEASLTDEEVGSMYRACDALVHPYRGEGFGLPVAEAMACALPVIVTAAGACRDFCDEETAYLVPAIEVPMAMDDFGPSQAGHWWAEPDRQALGAMMREVAASPEAAREVGRRGRARMTERFTWDRAAAIALSRLEGLAGKTPVRVKPPDAFRPGLAPLPLDEHRRVVFFHHPDWGTDAWRDVVASYLRAFDADADATLALWLDPRSGVSADLAAEAIMEVVAESGRAPEAVPDLLLVPDPLEPDELARLYTAADWVVPGGDSVQAERAARVGKPVLQALDIDAWRAALSQ
ncbi:MAG: glycosyltransferase family 4 protein, partial [Candidatus Sericytochromatia bacterium]